MRYLHGFNKTVRDLSLQGYTDRVYRYCLLSDLRTAHFERSLFASFSLVPIGTTTRHSVMILLRWDVAFNFPA